MAQPPTARAARTRLDARGGGLKRQAETATVKWAESVDAFMHEHPEMWWNWLDKRWAKILRGG